MAAEAPRSVISQTQDILDSSSRDISSEARLIAETWREKDTRYAWTALRNVVALSRTTSARAIEVVRRLAPEGTDPRLVSLGTNAALGLVALAILRALFQVLIVVGAVAVGGYVILRYNSWKADLQGGGGASPAPAQPVRAGASEPSGAFGWVGSGQAGTHAGAAFGASGPDAPGGSRHGHTSPPAAREALGSALERPAQGLFDLVSNAIQTPAAGASTTFYPPPSPAEKPVFR